MSKSSSLSTVVIFISIALLLAIVASFLPINKENVSNKIKDFRVSYEPISPPGVKTDDFLKFELSCDENNENSQILKSQPVDQFEEATELIFVPSESIVVTENSVASSNDPQESAQVENEIRQSAIKSENIEDCDEIENEYSAQNCRDEINFRTAFVDQSFSTCDKIINPKLKSRCQNYINLTQTNEISY
jgi:hypothetical protein